MELLYSFMVGLISAGILLIAIGFIFIIAYIVIPKTE